MIVRHEIRWVQRQNCYEEENQKLQRGSHPTVQGDALQMKDVNVGESERDSFRKTKLCETYDALDFTCKL